MLDRIRRHVPGHTTVVAYLALFIALGGTSVAALRIGSEDIRDNSVRSRDLRNNDVRGKDVRNGTLSGRDVARDRLGGRAIEESSLGTVPRAQFLIGDQFKELLSYQLIAVRIARVPIGAGQTLQATASCTGQERALGGGAEISAFDPADRIVQSAPTDLESGAGGLVARSWRVAGTNASGDSELVAYAVCAPPAK